jgi:ABC-type nitrate/sulfonate/bicarbonate transport system substrate-binding protein
MVAGPGVQKPQQLKGKKFGLGTFGDRTDFLTRYMLKREGLEPGRDVVFVAVGEPSQRLMALQNRIIDATILSGGYVVQARQQGLKVLETPPVPFLREAQVTTRRFLTEKRPAVKAYLEGLVESIHFFLTQKEKTKRLLASFLRSQDASVLEESYNDVALTIDRKPYPTEEAIQNVFQMIAESEPKAREQNPMAMWDLSLIKELDQSGWIDSLYR